MTSSRATTQWSNDMAIRTNTPERETKVRFFSRSLAQFPTESLESSAEWRTIARVRGDRTTRRMRKTRCPTGQPLLNSQSQSNLPLLARFAQAEQLARYRTLSKGTTDVPAIPRRGEKDFSPLPTTSILNSTEEARTLSAYQLATLANSRAALFSALDSGTRNHSSKSHNSFTWRPELSRATNDNPATFGIHFNTIGSYQTERKRVELLPEEALYLCERGILELYTETEEDGVINRAPMSVQQAWGALIGHDDLTLERFQVRFPFPFSTVSTLD